ncbi:MAG: four helix bundle protein [Flavobacteriia bacterium]|nr:four helix bundle protein [Flavobacteriia bacterium]PIV48892.1 MAG: four helix bundle protein [Flavobacteriaceae bacterium CG02_land_8_20_14_3_00_34_13]PJC06732.1 MAG: four helix bundle protein [Flavobacteriaceae bacterium CG_4_9_14_0_8_um_filter_34_30]
MQGNKENIIVKKSFEFALAIISYCESLEELKKYIIARQLLKSGTSIGANIREAQNAESKADFIHKMKIAAKEADETEYWLLLCQNSLNYPNCENIQTDCKELILILSKIIGTSKKSISKFSN